MEQWFAVRCLLVLLEPFGVATEVLSGADYPTLAIAFRCLRAVKSELQNGEMFAREVGLQGDHAFVHGTIKLMHVVRTTMLDIFRKRFSGMDLDLLWISYLDPRLTDMHMIMAEEVALAKHAIISAAMEISKEDTLDASAMSDASVDTSPLPTPKKAKSSMYAAIFGQRMSTRPQLNEPQIDQDHVLRTKCESEFHMYLEQTTKVRDRHDPFEWWRAHAGRFPTLEKLARKWHCCVATSVPSERAFSTGQNTVTARRSSLGPELVRDLVFVAENYRDKKITELMARSTSVRSAHRVPRLQRCWQGPSTTFHRDVLPAFVLDFPFDVL
ncbi:Electron transfer flavoprotein beta subunit, partial [Globisporangium splendens]